jgi:hypothetical protein
MLLQRCRKQLRTKTSPIFAIYKELIQGTKNCQPRF